MSRNWEQDEYLIKNPKKYLGNPEKPIKYKSSWEGMLMDRFDSHPNVLQWGYEPFRIPYVHPFKREKASMYVPDFAIIYEDVKSRINKEILEIKPARQAHIERAMNQRDAIITAINLAKWESAKKWAEGNGFKMRIITEDLIFNSMTGMKPKRKR